MQAHYLFYTYCELVIEPKFLDLIPQFMSGLSFSKYIVYLSPDLICMQTTSRTFCCIRSNRTRPTGRHRLNAWISLLSPEAVQVHVNSTYIKHHQPSLVWGLSDVIPAWRWCARWPACLLANQTDTPTRPHVAPRSLPASEEDCRDNVVQLYEFQINVEYSLWTAIDFKVKCCPNK